MYVWHRCWLWQDNEGAARWTLILDDVLRRASINHPPRTAAGLKNQVNHQSRLKLALVHAFGLWTLEELFRGNGVTLRTQKVIQGGDNGHVGRPCEVSPAPPCPELFCELRGLCRHSYFGPRTWTFVPHYPTTISLHPNTETLDATGNIVPFGTNLFRAIGIEIIPEDTDGVTRALLELLRQIKTFPGLQHGLNPLKSWCDRVLLLFNDLVRLTTPIDQNQTICSHLDMLISSYGTPPTDPISWNRCKDLLKSNTVYVAAPSVSQYMQHIK